MGNEISADEAQNQVPVPNELSLRWDYIKTSNGPLAREGHLLIPYQKQFFIFGGGYKSNGGPVQLTDFWSFDTGTLSSNNCFIFILIQSVFLYIELFLYIYMTDTIVRNKSMASIASITKA